MKPTYTTAQGKKISMESLRLANEQTIAVGNMKVNARGDQLGPGGVPMSSRQQAVNEYYNLHTPTVGAERPHIAPEQPKPRLDTAPIPPSADPLIDEQDQIEVFKEQPEMRGKLAGAVAKTATVNQELLKPLRKQIKDNGPTRI
jgi:hypothetical protein